jgi:hypothetical protein
LAQKKIVKSSESDGKYPIPIPFIRAILGKIGRDDKNNCKPKRNAYLCGALYKKAKENQRVKGSSKDETQY